MAIVAVSIAPIGEGLSLHEHVAAALAPLRGQSRVRWKLDSMFTTLEGELGEVMSLVQEMHEAVFATGAQRVSTLIKIDDRRDRVARMQDKVRVVVERTGVDQG